VLTVNPLNPPDRSNGLRSVARKTALGSFLLSSSPSQSAPVSSRNKPVVVVVGGVQLDLVVRTLIPDLGTTVEGGDVALVAGGKGGNHAVAATRLGASVHLVGRVGTDELGRGLLTDLENHGVSTTFVTVTEGVASGTSITMVDPATGENAVVVSPAANGRMTTEDVDRAMPMIKSAACVLLSLDVPRAVVAHTVEMCHSHRVPVILNSGYVPGWARRELGDVVNGVVPIRGAPACCSEAEPRLGTTRSKSRKRRPLNSSA
jgi:sugar/nucleoside kinase (ribokinase family)